MNGDTLFDDYLPRRVNEGPWITAYTLYELRRKTAHSLLHDPPETVTPRTFVLPICSLTTPYHQCAKLADLVLPPLYHEALDERLKAALITRIAACFPVFGGEQSQLLRIDELPRLQLPPSRSPSILVLSVDTAVEEHGPHLPLATDTIQSYSVLAQLATEFSGMEIARPLDYGQLTWGLPFGYSIDLTADLLAAYVARYVSALANWKRPKAIYVVDVHGSINHRNAIVRGLQDSGYPNWSFRWLHEPLAEFASERGDQHAGGVETALVERVSPELLDSRWWPDKIEQIAAGQMAFQQAVSLGSDLDAWKRHVDDHSLNGVIGDVRNYHHVDAEEMFQRMMEVARRDIDRLLCGKATQTAGEDLW